jgi:hypothetical protein
MTQMTTDISIPFVASFMTYHKVCNKSNTTGVTCAAETAYFSTCSEHLSSSQVFRRFELLNL